MSTKLTASVVVLGAALAGAALAPAPAQAIITGNGKTLNGTSLNGREHNGTVSNMRLMNGTVSNLRVMNGVEPNALIPNVRVMNGVSNNGADPAGASFTAPGEDAAALSTRALRVRELILPDGRRLTTDPRP